MENVQYPSFLRALVYNHHHTRKLTLQAKSRECRLQIRPALGDAEEEWTVSEDVCPPALALILSFLLLVSSCYLLQFAWSTRELNPRPRRQKRDKGVNNSSQGALAFCMQFNLHLKTWTFLRTVSGIYLNWFWIQVGWTEMVK